VFTGYIDDSGSNESNLLTLSCLIGWGSEWQYIEWMWLNCLEKKNKQLKAQGRVELSRYHAADCSSREREFKDWTVPEQIEFTNWLINVFRRHRLAVIAYTLDIQDLIAEFPEAKKNPRGLAHIILLNHLMVWTSEKILDDARWPKDSIALIHDHGDYDAVLFEAFNHMKNDKSLKHRKRFTTIEPSSWQESVNLQPADLIAYENFKAVEREFHGHKRRKSFELILDLDSIGGRGVKLQRAALKEMKSKLDRQSKRILFENARIAPLKKPKR
jgi:hypothetical protein